MRICMFDLECTNLKANYGFALCASYKYTTSKYVNTFSIFDGPEFQEDPTNDRYVIESIAEVLSNSDIIVGHYSTRFDLPYIQARLLFHGLPIVNPRIPHIDTWRIARQKLALSSNRLQAITEHLGFEDKTALKSRIWVKAMSGDRASIEYIVEHCEQDVKVLEEVYTQLRPLMTNHPNINLTQGIPNACPTCGGVTLTKQGFKIARLRKAQQYKCIACGSWCLGPYAPIEGVDIS